MCINYKANTHVQRSASYRDDNGDGGGCGGQGAGDQTSILGDRGHGVGVTAHDTRVGDDAAAGADGDGPVGAAVGDDVVAWTVGERWSLLPSKAAGQTASQT